MVAGDVVSDVPESLELGAPCVLVVLVIPGKSVRVDSVERMSAKRSGVNFNPDKRNLQEGYFPEIEAPEQLKCCQRGHA